MPNRETRNGHCGQEETKDYDHQIQTDYFPQSVELARRRRLEIYTIHDRGVRSDAGHSQQDCAKNGAAPPDTRKAVVRNGAASPRGHGHAVSSSGQSNHQAVWSLVTSRFSCAGNAKSSCEICARALSSIGGLDRGRWGYPLRHLIARLRREFF